ncbi:MAG: DUF2341 domain-containing protein, partial [Candidatus Omnitrophota bacterium]
SGSFNNLTINRSSGGFTLGSNILVTGLFSLASGALDLGGHSLTASGDVSITGGSFTGTGSLTLFTSTTKNIPSGLSYANLTLGGTGIWALISALDVNGSLTINNGTTVNAGSYAISIEENLTNNGTFNTTGTITFDGTAAGNTITPGTATYASIVINGIGGEWALQGALSLSGALTIQAGTLDLNGNALSFASANNFFNSGTLKLRGSETLTNFTNDADSGTVIYTGTTSYTGLKAGNIYCNLTFNGTGSWTLNGALDVNGNFTITQGTVNASGYAMTVAGNWTNAGTFNHGNNTVTFDGTAAEKTITSGNSPFYHVIFDSTGSIWGLGDTLTLGGNLTINNGTLSLSGRNLTLALSSVFTNNDTLRLIGSETLTNFVNDTNSGTVEYTGSRDYATLAAGYYYYHLVFSSASVFERAITITNSNGVTLTDYQVYISFTSSNFSFANSTSDGHDIRFYDSDGLTLLGYYIASWDQSGQTGGIWVNVPSLPAGNKTIYVQYGDATLASASDPSIMSRGGSVNNAYINPQATWTPSTGDISDTTWSDAGRDAFDSFGNPKIVYNGTTYNIDMNNFGTTTLTLGSLTVKVIIEMANANTYRIRIVPISSYNGETASKIYFSGNLGSDGSTYSWTQETTLYGAAYTYWSSNDDSTADGLNSDPQLRYAVISGDSAYQSNAYMTRTGDNLEYGITNTTLPVTMYLVVGDIGETSFENWLGVQAGYIQSKIASVEPTASVGSATALVGTWTLPSALDVNGDMTINGSTINANGKTINMGGNFVNNGIFNHGNNTVIFDSSLASRTITPGSAQFYNLTFNGTGGWDPQANITIAHDLSVQNGTFSVNGKTITVNGNFSKSNGTLNMTAANSTLDVNGNFTVTGGSVNMTTGIVNVAGNVDISGDNSFNVAGTSLSLDGALDSTISVSGANNDFGYGGSSYFYVNKTSAANIVTLLSGIASHHFIHQEGIFNVNGFNASFDGVYYGLAGSTLRMSSGTFRVGQNAYTGGNYSPWYCESGWAEDISGGTIDVYGGKHTTYGTAYFSDGSNFTPTGGTFRLIGTDTASIYIAETHAADFNFYNLTIGDGTNAKTVE